MKVFTLKDGKAIAFNDRETPTRGREMTILEFARAVQKAAGRRLEIVHKPLPEDDPKQRRPDIAKARKILGWEPRVELEEGLRWTFEHFGET